MDEMRLIERLLVEERPPSARTTALARRRLTDQMAASEAGLVLRLLGTRWFRITVVVTAVMAMVAMVGGMYYARTRPLYRPEPLPGQSGPASNFLLAAADAKARQHTAGRLWYVRTRYGNTHRVRSLRHPDVHYYLEVTNGSYLIVSRETDEVGEEGNIRAERAQVRPVGAEDREAWTADGRPQAYDFGLPAPDGPRGGPDGHGGAELDFGLEDTLKLPSDPPHLRAWLLNYATKFDRVPLEDPDLYLFVNTPVLLLDRVTSDRVRIAMYRILASMAGVRLVTSTDAAGRTGQAVAMRQTTAEHGTIEWQLFIDPSTGQLTAIQGVVVRPGTENGGLPPGARHYFEVVLRAEWTDAPIDRLRPSETPWP